MASIQTAPARKALVGVVVSAGKMDKCVKVRIPKQVWNKKVRKYFTEHDSLLVSDPANSTRAGDIVRIRDGYRNSTRAARVSHIVTSIISPFGAPLSERPAIPTEEEQRARRHEKKVHKDERQALRGRKLALERVMARRTREGAGATELGEDPLGKAFAQREAVLKEMVERVTARLEGEGTAVDEEIANLLQKLVIGRSDEILKDEAAGAQSGAADSYAGSIAQKAKAMLERRKHQKTIEERRKVLEGDLQGLLDGVHSKIAQA